MARPTDEVALANIACDHLGEAALIANIDTPTSNIEKIAARHFAVERRALLRDTIWNFALTETLVTRNGGPILGFADAYTKPTDFIRFVGINDGDYNYAYKPVRNRIYRNSILLDNDGSASAKLVYVADIEDINLWDPSFVKAFGFALALAMAFQVTKDEKIVARVNQQFESAMAAAVSADGQENPPIRIETSPIIEARKGFVGDSVGYDNSRYNLP